MSIFLEKENCSIHNESCAAINIEQSDNIDNLLLCFKCLTDKLAVNNPILLNNEAAIILKEIKLKEYQKQKSQIEQSIDIYQTSMTKIKNYIYWLNGCLNKITIQLDSEIESLQSELNQLKNLKVEDLVKSDVSVLLQNMIEQKKSNSQQINNTNQIKTKEFLKLVENQLQNLRQDDNFQEILNYLNQIIYEKERQIEQQVENPFDSEKTSFLQHKCSKHGKEIMMFPLDKDYQGERALCIECIPNFQNEVVTLENTNNLQMVHQGELYKKIPKRSNFTVNQLNQHKFFYQLNTKLLKFSTSLKHQDITISADGKTAKLSYSGSYLCLCDQPIPKYGTVVVDFKVKQLQFLMAGVCLIDSINKNYNDSHGFGKGCYFLYHQGYIFSHHDNEKNNELLGFSYEVNDIISLEVNVEQKQITWRNKEKNQVYTLGIQATSDLYFCFNLANQTEIELL